MPVFRKAQTYALSPTNTGSTINVDASAGVDG